MEKACCTLVSPAPASSPHGAPVRQDPKLPELAIISTGGTIASRIDYRTGAVTSQFDADDILTAIPALAEIGRYRTKVLYTILSENMTPAIWQELAKAVYDEIKHGVAGVIVTHGTDTMAYSAAALSFMLDTPVPVIFVGSQRSADRPSSDNAMNGVCAAGRQRAISAKLPLSCTRPQTMMPAPSTGAPGYGRCTPPGGTHSGASGFPRSGRLIIPPGP